MAYNASDFDPHRLEMIIYRLRLKVREATYAGQSALAVGYARRLPGNGAVLIGGSIAGGGESSGSVGVSFGW
jgi:trimeric autotransporter adhesin